MENKINDINKQNGIICYLKNGIKEKQPISDELSNLSLMNETKIINITLNVIKDIV